MDLELVGPNADFPFDAEMQLDGDGLGFGDVVADQIEILQQVAEAEFSDLEIEFARFAFGQTEKILDDMSHAIDFFEVGDESGP